MKISESEITQLVNNSQVLVGIRQVSEAIISATIDKIIVAKDADRHMIEQLEAKAQDKSIPLVTGPSKSELGKLAKIEVACAVIGILHRT